MEKVAFLLVLGLLTMGCLQSGTPSPTPEACTQEFAPVCGVDGETYSNACFAEKAGVAVEHEGECKTPSPTPADSCRVYRNDHTRQVQCFGCAEGVCTTPEPGFEPYQPGEVGIPYACFPTPEGCALAQ